MTEGEALRRIVKVSHRLTRVARKVRDVAMERLRESEDVIHAIRLANRRAMVSAVHMALMDDVSRAIEEGRNR